MNLLKIIFGLVFLGYFIPSVTQAEIPHWLSSSGKAYFSSRPYGFAEMPGKHFLMLPHSDGDGNANWTSDPRVLLSFGNDSLTVEGVGVKADYGIVYHNRMFDFTNTGKNLGGNDESGIDIFAESLNDYGIAAQGDTMFLCRDRIKRGRNESRNMGVIRELSADDAERFRKHLKQRQATLDEIVVQSIEEAGQSKPVTQINSHDFPYPGIFADVYYGDFKKIYAEIYTGKTLLDRAANQRLAKSKINNLFRSYHSVYSDLYVKDRELVSDDPDWSVYIARWRVTDQYGKELQPDSDPTRVYIRTRYAQAFLGASRSPGGLETIAIMGEHVNIDAQAMDTVALAESLVGHEETSRVFLNYYLSRSPATVRHFEANLFRAIQGEAPEKIHRPDNPMTWKKNPLKLPWEDSGQLVPQRHEPEGLSWSIPDDWQPTDKPNRIAWYEMGATYKAACFFYSKDHPNPDVLAWANDALRRADQPQVNKIEDTGAEKLIIDGRQAWILFTSESNYALVNDGERTWYFIMYGNTKQVRERRDEFKAVVSSMTWVLKS